MLSPGTYIRLRREAERLSRYELALKIATAPSIDALRRAQWIAAIEADGVPISADIVVVLRNHIRFDPMILVQLIAIYAGADIVAPDICTSCGCTWDDACLDDDQVGCGWRGPDRNLCTACPVPAPIPAAATATASTAPAGAPR